MASFSLVALVSVVAGIVVDAAFLHLGRGSAPASLVIAEKVVRKPPPGSVPQAPPPGQPSPLAWGEPVLVDPSGQLTALSCPTSAFCAAVDAEGRAVEYLGGAWTAPAHVDDGALTSVSCPTPTFCVAVDQQGDALTYDGKAWSPPQRIDRTTFPGLTSVSCASESFCAAVDGDGNGLVYSGGRWSAPVQVDPQGWSLVSRDVAAVSCPSDGFCAGVDHQDNTFFYVAGSWQAASAPTSSGAGSGLEFENPISCSSTRFCVAGQNLGDLLTFDGTQWSSPVPADPTNYIVSVACVSSSFCAALDGLLPPGFNTYSGNGNGRVVTYDGVSWSAAREVDDAGIASAISCPTAAFCMVVDETGHAVAASDPLPGPSGS